MKSVEPTRMDAVIRSLHLDGTRSSPSTGEPGRPLDTQLRRDFERGFGYDFSQVRVHTQATAAESARSLSARAYTTGRDIVFGGGQFAPHTAAGRQLIAHELAHVLQQTASSTSVERMPLTGPTPEEEKKAAHLAVDGFRKSSGPSAWLQLKRDSVADDLDARIDNPDLMFQGPLNLCGATSVVYLLATSDPVSFVSMARQLFETGSATLDGVILSAGPDLRANAPPATMQPAEWMLMSSMQDSENAILDYEGTPSLLEPLAGLATPGAIVDFMKAVLKCKTVDWKHAYLTGELDVIKEAGAAASAGKRVILLIDADMLKKNPDVWVGIPNHWIVLRSGVAFTEISVEKEGKVVSSENRVQFDAWSWGQTYRIDLPQRTFVKTFFGAAIGSP